MSGKRLLSLLSFSLALLTAGSQPWKDKPVSDWNDDDARLILTDSPWAKTVPSTMDSSAQNGPRQSRGMGRGGGINLGGIGIGIPGMGRRGGGYPGGGYPGGGNPGGQPGGGATDAGQPPSLRMRWESAMPVRAAELKTREANSPTLDEDHYAIAVYDVPGRLVTGSPDTVAAQLKKQAVIKREGKPDLKPSGVDVLQREDGPVIVYLFPRAKEITRQDKRVEFDGAVGKLRFTHAFYVDDMVCQGKLEL